MGWIRSWGDSALSISQKHLVLGRRERVVGTSSDLRQSSRLSRQWGALIYFFHFLSLFGHQVDIALKVEPLFQLPKYF